MTSDMFIVRKGSQIEWLDTKNTCR